LFFVVILSEAKDTGVTRSGLNYSSLFTYHLYVRAVIALVYFCVCRGLASFANNHQRNVAIHHRKTTNSPPKFAVMLFVVAAFVLAVILNEVKDPCICFCLSSSGKRGFV
jgi:hypothetical protein